MNRISLHPLTVGLLLALAATPALAKPVFAPAPVAVAAEESELLVGRYLHHDWKAASPMLEDLQASLTDLQALLRQHAGTDNTGPALQQALQQLLAAQKAQQQPLVAADAANRISALVAQVRAGYPTRVPEAVERLDQLGRQVEIDAARGAPAAQLQQSVQSAHTTWAKLRPQVTALHGEAIAQAMDSAIGKLTAAGDAKAWRTAAEAVQSQVDRLENLFVEAETG